MYIRTCIRMYVCTCIRKWVRMYLRTCVRTYVRMYVRACVRPYVRGRVYFVWLRGNWPISHHGKWVNFSGKHFLLTTIIIRLLYCKHEISFVASKTFVCSKQSISCVPNKTLPVFHAKHFLCSTHNISCAPRKTFPAIVIPYHHIIISSYHHMISSHHHIVVLEEKMKVGFGPKLNEKNEIRLWTPSPRNVETWNSGHLGWFFVANLLVTLKNS